MAQETTQSWPAELQPAAELFGRSIVDAYNWGHHSYPGVRVAPFSAMQQSAFGMLPGMVNDPRYQQGFDQSRQMLMGAFGAPMVQAATRGWGEDARKQYENPYTQGVVDTTLADIDTETRKALARASARQAARRGGGQLGEGADIALNDLEERGLRAKSSAAANLRNQGYSQAQQAFSSDMGRGLQAAIANQQAGLQNRALGRQAALDYANLGLGQYGMNLQGINALLAAGGQQQAQGQREADAAYQEWSRQNNFGKDNAQWLGAMLRGTPMNQSVSGTASPWATAAGLGTTALGLLGGSGAFGTSANPGWLTSWFAGADGGEIPAPEGYADGGAPSADIQALIEQKARALGVPPAVLWAELAKAAQQRDDPSRLTEWPQVGAFDAPDLVPSDTPGGPAAPYQPDWLGINSVLGDVPGGGPGSVYEGMPGPSRAKGPARRRPAGKPSAASPTDIPASIFDREGWAEEAAPPAPEMMGAFGGFAGDPALTGGDFSGIAVSPAMVRKQRMRSWLERTLAGEVPETGPRFGAWQGDAGPALTEFSANGGPVRGYDAGGTVDEEDDSFIDLLRMADGSWGEAAAAPEDDGLAMLGAFAPAAAPAGLASRIQTSNYSQAQLDELMKAMQPRAQAAPGLFEGIDNPVTMLGLGILANADKDLGQAIGLGGAGAVRSLADKRRQAQAAEALRIKSAQAQAGIVGKQLAADQQARNQALGKEFEVGAAAERSAAEQAAQTARSDADRASREQVAAANRASQEAIQAADRALKRELDQLQAGRPTALMRDAIAAGLKPGSAEFNQFIMQAHAPSGFLVEMGPDGKPTRIVQGKNVAESGMTPKTQGALEEDLISATKDVSDLNRIATGFDPKFLQWPTQGINWAANQIEKAGFEAPEAMKKDMERYYAFRRDVSERAAVIRNKLFGAALTKAEQGSAQEFLPSTSDGPTEFKSKMDRTLDTARRAVMRLNYIRKNGLSMDAISLDQMPSIMNERGNALAASGMSKEDVKRALAEEFGLIAGK